MSKENTFFFLFIYYSFSHYISLTILSLSLSLSLSLACCHSRTSSRLHLILTFSGTSLLSSPNGQMALLYISSSFSSFNVSHKFTITSSFMWLDFCTSLHKCCWTSVDYYRAKFAQQYIFWKKFGG